MTSSHRQTEAECPSSVVFETPKILKHADCHTSKNRNIVVISDFVEIG